MSNGRNCDNCETHLNDEDYVSYGSWSYTCHDCGFSYRHGSAGVGEQVERFNAAQQSMHADAACACPDDGNLQINSDFVCAVCHKTPRR